MANLILNPGFEDSPALTHWTLTGAPTFMERSSVYKRTGSYSAKLRDPTSSYNDRTLTGDEVAVTPGLTYIASAYVLAHRTSGRGLSSDMHFRMRILWKDSSHNLISIWPTHQDGKADLVSFDTWTRYAPPGGVAPGSAAYAQVRVQSREYVSWGNDAYWDDISLEGMEAYAGTPARITGSVGAHYLVQAARILGQISGYAYTLATARIWGKISGGTYLKTARITGKITVRTYWITDPANLSANFLAKQDASHCKPVYRVLLYHEDFAENYTEPVDYRPPNGTYPLRYLDITSRIKSIGTIDRAMPMTPGESSNLYVSDNRIILDNSDDYFTDYSSDSPLYGLKYTGFNWNNRIEIWSGYQTGATAEVLIQAKMIIARINPDSNTGQAEMTCRDFCYKGLNKNVGWLETTVGDYTGDTLDLEYPQYAISAALANNTMQFKTQWSGAGYQTITIPDGSYGLYGLAYWIQRKMNECAALTGPEGDDNHIDFTVNFLDLADDGNKGSWKYVISKAGGNTVFKMDASTPALPNHQPYDHLGFTSVGVYTAVDEAITGTVAVSQSITFKEVLDALLGTEAALLAADLDIEDIALSFERVQFPYGTSVSQCASDISFCGAGVLYAKSGGKITFRTFRSLPQSIGTVFDNTKNYSVLKYCGQDIDICIRKISIFGRYKNVIGETNSGEDTGNDYQITNNNIETKALADSLAVEYLSRFNVKPALLEIEAEGRPSLDPGSKCVVYDNLHPSATFSGHVAKVNYSPTQIRSTVSIMPFTSQIALASCADWDDYQEDTAEEINNAPKLLAVHDLNWLETKLLEVSGSRVYERMTEGGVAVRWVGLTQGSDLDSKIIFRDHFDIDTAGRYAPHAEEHSGYERVAGYEWDSVVKALKLYSISNSYIHTGIFLCPVGFDSIELGHNLSASVKYLISQVEESSTRAHYNNFGLYLRYVSADSLIYFLQKCARSNESSPAVGKRVSGHSTLLSPSGVKVYSGLNIDTILTGTTDGASAKIRVSPFAGQESSYTIPLLSSESHASVMLGCGRCEATVSQFEISRLTPSPSSVGILLWSYNSGAWKDALGNVYPVGGTAPEDIATLPTGTGIKIKITLTRNTFCCSVPVLKYLIINHSNV